MTHALVPPFCGDRQTWVAKDKVRKPVGATGLGNAFGGTLRFRQGTVKRLMSEDASNQLAVVDWSTPSPGIYAPATAPIPDFLLRVGKGDLMTCPEAVTLMTPGWAKNEPENAGNMKAIIKEFPGATKLTWRFHPDSAWPSGDEIRIQVYQPRHQLTGVPSICYQLGVSFEKDGKEQLKYQTVEKCRKAASPMQIQ